MLPSTQIGTRLIRLSLIAVLMLPVVAGDARAGEQRLLFRMSGHTVTELTLTRMLELTGAREIRFFNPLMNKQKRYMAVKLKDVLDSVYADAWSSSDYSDASFRALDGYEAIGSLALLAEDGAFLAYEDLDWEKGWEPVGRKHADPGPFFLVWTEKHQTTANAYPWPWQLTEIDLLRFEDQYPAVMPRGAAPGSPERSGFQLFRDRCLRCHAMNEQGGKLGPDLNAPQSIVAYRSEEMIKSYIRQASKYRYTQMPDHPDLSDRDLDNLYRYFQHQDRHRTPPASLQ